MAEISFASVERLIKFGGTQRVSNSAVLELRDYLEKEALRISRKAQKLSKYAGRKTVTDTDVRMSISTDE